MSQCFNNSAVVACHTNAAGVRVAAVIHYEYDNAGAPAVRITDAAGVIIVGANVSNTKPGQCQAPSYTVNPVHWCDGSTCVEGKAWYDSETGALVRVNLLDGHVVDPDPATLREGKCELTITERPVCVKMNNGEIWNVIERSIENTCGSLAIVYLDPDTSPMKDVTADVGGFVSNGECDCCP